MIFTMVHYSCLFLKVRGFMLTGKTVNLSIALSTSIFWGYFFDVVLFGKSLDWFSIGGALLVVIGSFINYKPDKKKKVEES